jgi:ribosomal protein S18 acetylase RimI-like enzyme
MAVRESSATDRVLYERMLGNLIASWEAYAEGAAGAALLRLGDAAVAIFPAGPERIVYNNAVLDRDLSGPAAGAAVRAVQAVYADAGVAEYALWVHESEAATVACLEQAGYHVDTSTRAMAMDLATIPVPRPQIEEGPNEWQDYLRVLTDLGGPEGVLAGAEASAFQVRIATSEQQPDAAAIAYDHEGDCGIYNVGTLPHARRRGLGTALTALHLHDARDRGCTSASLQATPVAEGIYRAVGFRNLGRFIEYVM